MKKSDSQTDTHHGPTEQANIQKMLKASSGEMYGKWRGRGGKEKGRMLTKRRRVAKAMLDVS